MIDSLVNGAAVDIHICQLQSFAMKTFSESTTAWLTLKERRQLLDRKCTEEAWVRGVADVVLTLTHILLKTVLPALDAAG